MAKLTIKYNMYTNNKVIRNFRVKQSTVKTERKHMEIDLQRIVKDKLLPSVAPQTYEWKLFYFVESSYFRC